MGTNWRLVIILTLLCALAIHAQQTMRKHAAKKPADNPVWTELQSSMEKMQMAMTSIAASGNSDVDFVRLMLPHHQAAIDMAKTELMYGNDPQMRRLAQEIITDQQSEIELMNLWLKQRAHSAKVSQLKFAMREEN